MDRLRKLFKKEDGATAGGGGTVEIPSSAAHPTNNNANVTGKSSNSNNTSGPPSPVPSKAYVVMDSTLQKNLASLKYNMKIVIRGAPKTGKTCLFRRLQGHDIGVAYARTPHIQVGTIPWCSKDGQAPDTKVEVWDVVDEGTGPNVPDARSVDVYRHATMAILMFDATRRETFDYVKAEAKKIPNTTAVLILCNFYDNATRIVVQDDEVAEVCGKVAPTVTKYNTSPGLHASYLRTSMTSCIGLSALHAYMNLPVTLLRIRSLESQAENLWEKLLTERNDFAKSYCSSDAVARPHKPKPYVHEIADDDLPAAMRRVDDAFFGSDDDQDEGEKPKAKRKEKDHTTSQQPRESSKSKSRDETPEPKDRRSSRAPSQPAVPESGVKMSGVSQTPPAAELMAIIEKAQTEIQKQLENSSEEPARRHKSKKEKKEKTHRKEKSSSKKAKVEEEEED